MTITSDLLAPLLATIALEDQAARELITLLDRAATELGYYSWVLGQNAEKLEDGEAKDRKEELAEELDDLSDEAGAWAHRLRQELLRTPDQRETLRP